MAVMVDDGRAIKQMVPAQAKAEPLTLPMSDDYKIYVTLGNPRPSTTELALKLIAPHCKKPFRHGTGWRPSKRYERPLS